ncbi:MAG: PQQ-binding-like beta-propeller repeat protein [Candidatus Sulfotelmatobacter sp.]
MRVHKKGVAIGIGIILATSVVSLAGTKHPSKGASQDWSIYGGMSDNNHYSSLKQINRKNVKRLQVAWTFDSDETGGLQTSPIEVGGVLYGLTPAQKVFALDASTGKLLWKFDSTIKGTQPDRGLAYWSDGQHGRILVGVMNFVYALDAESGTAISTFGQNGRIDLRDDLGRPPAEQSIFMTSPPVIYKNLMIVGGRESETLPASPGDIRAYDVRTGKLRWSFHTIPHPGEYGYETWPKGAWTTSGAANNWAGMTVDVAPGHCLRSYRIGRVRLLRRRSRRRRSVCGLFDRSQRRNGRTHMAFPGSASRPVGP